MIEEIVEVAEGLALDRSTWTLVRFGDVAIQQKENVDRENTDLKRYVAGEHMGSEDLHIRNWGDVNVDYLGPAFIRKFEAGDILYGSRRTYLRKVAVAHFDGITANTTFAIKPNEELIVKELLPFVMLSESFTQHSIRNSKGSVNPYINWKDIASYEFLLPPIDQQEQIAELLWAGDEAIQKKSDLNGCLKQLIESYIEDFLNQSAYVKSWSVCTISELASPDKYSCVGGPFGSNLTSKDYVQSPGVPVIRGTNLNSGLYSFNEEDFVYVSEEKAKKLFSNIAYPGDLIITQRGTMGQVALIPKSSAYKQFIISQSQMKLTVDDQKILPQYLYYYFHSRIGQDLIKNSTIATGVPHINLGIFKDFNIKVPPLYDQVSFVEKIDSIQRSIRNSIESLNTSQALQRNIINQIF